MGEIERKEAMENNKRKEKDREGEEGKNYKKEKSTKIVN